MSKLGWSYPPGAASDPYAPYNMEEEPDNADFEGQFGAFTSLYNLYRSIYKTVACGPSIGALIGYWEEVEPNGFTDYPDPEYVTKWFYCSDLAKLGTLKDMRERGELILALSVSSIVEGVDWETQTREVEWRPFEVEPEELRYEFWNAVRLVDEEASEIWDATHGCEACINHWRSICVPVDEWGGELDFGTAPVWDDCPECSGDGVAI